MGRVRAGGPIAAAPPPQEAGCRHKAAGGGPGGGRARARQVPVTWGGRRMSTHKRIVVPRHRASEGRARRPHAAKHGTAGPRLVFAHAPLQVLRVAGKLQGPRLDAALRLVLQVPCVRQVMLEPEDGAAQASVGRVCAMQDRVLCTPRHAARDDRKGPAGGSSASTPPSAPPPPTCPNKRPDLPVPPPPPCDSPSGCCFFAGPWTVARSSLRMLRRVAAFCRPLRLVLPLVSFPRSRSPSFAPPNLPLSFCPVSVTAPLPCRPP